LNIVELNAVDKLTFEEFLLRKGYGDTRSNAQSKHGLCSEHRFGRGGYKMGASTMRAILSCGNSGASPTITPSENQLTNSAWFCWLMGGRVGYPQQAKHRGVIMEPHLHLFMRVQVH
jgi:hypothetical protein